MENFRFRVQTQPSRKGLPKGSYTMHEIGRCKTPERNQDNWKRFRTREELDAYGAIHFLGACGNCWTDPAERAEENRKLAALLSS